MTTPDSKRTAASHYCPSEFFPRRRSSTTRVYYLFLRDVPQTRSFFGQAIIECLRNKCLLAWLAVVSCLFRYLFAPKKRRSVSYLFPTPRLSPQIVHGHSVPNQLNVKMSYVGLLVWKLLFPCQSPGRRKLVFPPSKYWRFWCWRRSACRPRTRSGNRDIVSNPDCLSTAYHLNRPH